MKDYLKEHQGKFKQTAAIWDDLGVKFSMPRKTLKKVKKPVSKAPKKVSPKKKTPMKRKPTKVVSKQDLTLHTVVSKCSRTPITFEEQRIETDLPQIRVQFVDSDPLKYDTSLADGLVGFFKKLWSKIASAAKRFFAGAEIQL